MTRKVFAIGWHKTGTTTIGRALHILGYRVVGCRLDLTWPLLEGDLEPAMELADRYDAFQDVPWAALFRELDQRFPDSLFIHSIRNESAWLESARRHFGGTDIPLHRWLYGHGRLSGNEELYLERYKRHNQEVREYFSANPSRLLVLSLEEDLNWRTLCSFLGYPEPRQAFPHENRASDGLSGLERLNRSAKSTLPAPFRRLGSRCKRILYSVAGKESNPDIFHNREQNRREIRNYMADPVNKL